MWRDSDYTIMICLSKCMNVGPETHLCGRDMSTFVLSDGHFSPPCVGNFFLAPDLLEMRLESLWGVC